MTILGQGGPLVKKPKPIKLTLRFERHANVATYINNTGLWRLPGVQTVALPQAGRKRGGGLLQIQTAK